MRRLLRDGRGQATRNGRPAGSRRRGTEELTYGLSQRRQRKRQGRVTDAPAHMSTTLPMNGRVARPPGENIRSWLPSVSMAGLGGGMVRRRLVGVNLVRPVGRSKLTPPKRRR